MKHTAVILCLAVLVVGCVPLAAQQTMPFKMVLWGTSGVPTGAEIDGYPINNSWCRGVSNFGRFECTTVGYMEKGAPVSDPDLCPGGMKVPIVVDMRNHIVRFETGGVLWMLPTEAYRCVTGQNQVHVTTWEFKGGSGIFQGATGSATWRFTGEAALLGSSYIGAAYPSPLVGEITLAEPQYADNEPPLAIAEPAILTTTANQIQLDGSDSWDREGGPLAYSWRVANGSAALIQGSAKTAKPMVVLFGGHGDYSFELTVTDPEGASDTATATIRYVSGQ